MRASACLLALAATLACGRADSRGPVIGVMTERTSKASSPGTSYMAASYVKYLEGAGARVVPIHYQYTTEELTALFGKLNGVLFPGGGIDISDPTNPLFLAGRTLYDLALKANAAGDYFPIWGTCLGFEMLNVITSETDILEKGLDSENYPIPLNFTAYGAKSSRMFKDAPAAVMEALATQAVTMNNHVSGVEPTTFANNAKLSSFYNVISTNVDRNGRGFVSTIEGKTMPVYGSQWHPEKNIYEWTPLEAIPHTASAVAVAQYTAGFLVSEARKSKHSFTDEDLQSYIIWNYSPTFSGKNNASGFDQSYFFNYKA